MLRLGDGLEGHGEVVGDLARRGDAPPEDHAGSRGAGRFFLGLRASGGRIKPSRLPSEPISCHSFSPQLFIIARSFPPWGFAILAHPRAGSPAARLQVVAESCDTKLGYNTQ